MAIRVFALLLLGTHESLAMRFSRRSDWPWSNKAEHVACPVMGALINAGKLTLDNQGRATQEQTLGSLMWMGNSDIMAAFQAKGIAAFKDNDPHQDKRERDGSYTKTKYLNYNVWNVLNECNGSNRIVEGFPCNTNIGFQQHGFSTTLRDPTDGSSAKSRWKKWMGLSGVLTKISGVKEKVMTIKGLGALLKEARLRGDKSGEFGLTANNKFAGSQLAFYHPSANESDQYLPASEWQALGAWAAFWALFARYEGDVAYMPESDLNRFFYDAKFPDDFEPYPWGFKETMKVVRELKGTGAGEEWVEVISGVLAQVGENAPEVNYAGGMLQALQTVGARVDDMNRNYPR